MQLTVRCDEQFNFSFHIRGLRFNHSSSPINRPNEKLLNEANNRVQWAQQLNYESLVSSQQYSETCFNQPDPQPAMTLDLIL
jgi:hypothetical protein